MRRLLLVLPAPALLTGCALAARSAEGREVERIWWISFWAGLAVAVVVGGLILWTMVRYRRRRDDDDLPPQFDVNIPAEVTYTAIPILIVLGLFLVTFPAENRIESLEGQPAVTVRVEAFNWSWRFTYEDQDVAVFGTPDDPPELVLPVGETIRFRLTSTDVIHAFYVRDFLFKRDAIPGRVTEFQLSIGDPGVYRGQCAEYCGLDHWRMRFTIRAVPAGEFDAWLAGQAPT